MSSYAIANDTIYVILVVIGGALVLRVRKLLHDPHNRVHQVVCVLLGLLGAAFVLGTDTIPPHLPLVNAYPDLNICLQHCCVVATGLALRLLMMALLGVPAQRMRRQVLLRSVIAAATVVALVVLFFSAPIGDNEFDFVTAYGGDPRVCAYLLVFLAYVATTLFGIARLTFAYARHATQPALRLGLRASALSALMGLVYAAHKALYTLAAFARVRLPWPESLVSTAIAALSVLTLLAGVTVAIWDTRLRRLRKRLRQHVAYRRIRPLWLAVCAAFPGLALFPPETSPAGLRVPDVDFWLYRFVIEINDAFLLLGPYRDDRVDELVLAKLPDGQPRRVDELISAANIAVALRRTTSTGYSAALVESPDTDVDGEIDWLARVARDVSRSPIVAEILAALPVPAPN
ncbi:MAG TPA: MAB_1171c family putative transporter [Pseudonocardiaceae bacterium]|nr:MAB_1171c family putative transporter [Pseudonocardiaceae bacterium]